MRPLLLLLLTLAATLLTGCESYFDRHPEFNTRNFKRVRVTNPRGELTADYIAEGGVWKTERNGYRFRAVQRTSGPPFPQTIQYPRGRRVEVNGANIVISRSGKPLWLYELDQTGDPREILNPSE